MIAKTDRNRDIIRKRITDPKKWTIRQLGEHFNLTERAVWEIVDRDLEVYASPQEVRQYKGLLRMSTVGVV